MNPLLISALISATLAFSTAWTWQGYRMDAYKLEVKNEQLSIERAGRQALADAQAKVTQAQEQAALAGERIRRDAAGAAASGNRVRDALAASVRSASTDLQTCTGQITTVSELLTASTDLSRRLATEADEWASQAVTLQSAWPTNNPLGK
jgi:hypothetical protein